jgi:hypothetical protein
MNMHLYIAAAALIGTVSLASHPAYSQHVRLGDIRRTPLMTEDLSVPGRQVVQVRVGSPRARPPSGTTIRVKSSSTSSKACSNISSTADRR